MSVQVGKWSPVTVKGFTPYERYVHTAVIWNHKLFIFGGHIFTEFNSNDLFQYDFKTKKWEEINNQPERQYPSPRNGHSACLYKDCMIIFAGYSGIMYGDLYAFNCRTLQWIKIHDTIERDERYPTPRCCHSVTVHGQYMYLFGGDNGTLLNDFWRLDCSNYKWEKLSSHGKVPLPRRYQSMVVYKNCIYVFGGRHSTGRYNDLFEYNTNENRWREMNCYCDIPSKRAAHSAVVVGDSMFIFGGYNGRENLNDFYEFNFSIRKWKKYEFEGSIPSKRENHTACMYEDKMIIFAGYDGIRMLNDMWQLTLHVERVMDKIAEALRRRQFVDVLFGF